MQIQCPVHNFPIEVTEEKLPDGKLKQIAVCTCNVPNNNYSGLVVWVKYPDVYVKEEIKPLKSIKGKE